MSGFWGGTGIEHWVRSTAAPPPSPRGEVMTDLGCPPTTDLDEGPPPADGPPTTTTYVKESRESGLLRAETLRFLLEGLPDHAVITINQEDPDRGGGDRWHFKATVRG